MRVAADLRRRDERPRVYCFANLDDENVTARTPIGAGTRCDECTDNCDERQDGARTADEVVDWLPRSSHSA
jgi:hypothetical protein